MKKLFLTFIAVTIALCSASAQKFRFVDATELGIHGYTKQTDKSPYYRFDHTPYNFSKSVVAHSKKPAGLYVAFKSNSSSISAIWDVIPMDTRDNLSFIMQHGLDLYMKVDGKWKYVMAPRIPCKLEPATYKSVIVKNLQAEEKEFLLYFPIWCEMTSLKIGVDNGATIEGTPSPFKHKVVVFGSSITHGAAASRAGLTYTAQMSRNLGIDFVNFGFAGQCRMQAEFLEFLKGCQADAFLFDTFSNPSIKQIYERLEVFVAEMVKAHPGKPLIFLQTPISETVDPKKNSQRVKRIDIVSDMMIKLSEQYKDVHFLDVPNVIGEDGTIDSTHPNDLGFYRFVQAYQPKIAKILKKYGIKGN